MAKYRFSSGLAMAPERDLRMLADMSRQGWHLSQIEGIRYRFEQGEPADFIYALNFEVNPDADMLSFYQASGWTAIVSEKGYQIFRAKAGTPPIFSDRESKDEVLHKSRRHAAKGALISGLMLLLWGLVAPGRVPELLEIVVMVILMVAFVFTFLPFLGFSRSILKK